MDIRVAAEMTRDGRSRSIVNLIVSKQLTQKKQEEAEEE